MEESKNISRIQKAIEQKGPQSLQHALGIEVLELTKQQVSAKMPVDHRTHQLFGVLHGGASVALAETICSIGACLFINLETQVCVGLEINANHLKQVSQGFVYAYAKPFHVGKRTQVWNIEIKNEDGDLVCISRCTVAVIERSK